MGNCSIWLLAGWLAENGQKTTTLKIKVGERKCGRNTFNPVSDKTDKIWLRNNLFREKHNFLRWSERLMDRGQVLLKGNEFFHVFQQQQQLLLPQKSNWGDWYQDRNQNLLTMHLLFFHRQSLKSWKKNFGIRIVVTINCDVGYNHISKGRDCLSFTRSPSIVLFLSFTCSPSMAVWLSGSLRKNCFSSPCASDTMIVEANMAENVLEEVVIRLEEEASVVEEVSAEARMMMVVVASISRMALPPQLQVPIFHFSQITKGTFYLKLREIRFLETGVSNPNVNVKLNLKPDVKLNKQNTNCPSLLSVLPSFSVQQLKYAIPSLSDHSLPKGLPARSRGSESPNTSGAS